jgi:sporulation protein YlmC with PRC-barrel domain
MTTTVQFTIGSNASCIDGECGVLTRVVIDPLTNEVTHLVIQPKHAGAESKLVALDLLDPSAGEQPHLKCSLAHFAALPAAEQTDFIPGNSGHPGYTPDQAMSWPYYGIGMGRGFGGLSPGADSGAGISPQERTYESVPAGEIDIHRGDTVHATDADIGRVQGLVISMPDHQVSHILLQEGHLFGRKDVSIPISAVAGVGHGINLNISKRQVQDLEPVAVLHPGRN